MLDRMKIGTEKTISRRILRIAFLWLTLAAAFSFVTPAQAQGPSWAVSSKTRYGSDAICIGLDKNTPVLEVCDGLSPDHAWMRTDLDELRSPALHDHCMDVSRHDYRKYAPIIFYRCNGGGNQKWIISENSIKTRNANLCLAPKDHQFVPGAGLVLAPCTDTAARRWNTGALSKIIDPDGYRFPGVTPPNRHAITTKRKFEGESLCVSSKDQRLFLDRCDASRHQKWVRTLQGELRSPGWQIFCIDVPGHNYRNYTRVIMYRCNTGGNQQWYVISENRIRAKNSNHCLAPENHEFVPGTPLVIAPCTDTAAKQWNTRPIHTVASAYMAADAGFPKFRQCYVNSEKDANGDRECYMKPEGGLKMRYGFHVGAGHHSEDPSTMDYGDLSVDYCAREHDRAWGEDGTWVTLNKESCNADIALVNCLGLVTPRTEGEREAKEMAIAAFSGPCLWFSD